MKNNDMLQMNKPVSADTPEDFLLDDDLVRPPRALRILGGILTPVCSAVEGISLISLSQIYVNN
jgi:hypothetical protein